MKSLYANNNNPVVYLHSGGKRPHLTDPEEKENVTFCGFYYAIPVQIGFSYVHGCVNCIKAAERKGYTDIPSTMPVK